MEIPNFTWDFYFVCVIRMLLIGPEIVMNALGTVWAFTEYIKCDNEEFTETAIESMIIAVRY